MIKTVLLRDRKKHTRDLYLVHGMLCTGGAGSGTPVLVMAEGKGVSLRLDLNLMIPSSNRSRSNLSLPMFNLIWIQSHLTTSSRQRVIKVKFSTPRNFSNYLFSLSADEMH